MEQAEALQELKRIQRILPELILCLAEKEERAPVRRYEKAGYFKGLYGIGATAYQDRRNGIREQIKKGRYPKEAIQDRLVDKAVFWDYAKYGYILRNYPRRAPEYNDRQCMDAALKMEGKNESEGI